jgi:hypothetical protein
LLLVVERQKQKTVEAFLLLEHGANPLTLAHTGASNSHLCLPLNPDSSPDLIPWLLHYSDAGEVASLVKTWQFT